MHSKEDEVNYLLEGEMQFAVVWNVFSAMLIGAAIIATPVSLTCYAVVKRFAVRRLQRTK